MDSALGNETTTQRPSCGWVLGEKLIPDTDKSPVPGVQVLLVYMPERSQLQAKWRCCTPCHGTEPRSFLWVWNPGWREAVESCAGRRLSGITLWCSDGSVCQYLPRCDLGYAWNEEGHQQKCAWLRSGCFPPSGLLKHVCAFLMFLFSWTFYLWAAAKSAQGARWLAGMPA